MRLLNCSLQLNESVAEYNHRPLRGVNFILVDTDGKILIQKRDSKAKVNPDCYCFPGGRIDEGEAPYTAVMREIYEETGIKQPELKKLGELFDFEYEMLGQTFYNRFFICTGITPMKHVISLEGEMIWLTYEELKQTPLVMEQNKIVDMLRIEKPS